MYIYVFFQRNRTDRIYRYRYTDVLFYSLSDVWPFCDSMDCSLPGSSVRGISQGRILEWAAISFSRGSSPPRDGTHIWFFTTESPRKPDRYIEIYKKRFFLWELVHTIMEAEKSPDMPSASWRTRKTSILIQSQAKGLRTITRSS